ncbi:efflux RND transporter permease subunit [Aliiglaciecola lipolytica]|uniref:Hydrophobic/amphiphilic exporter-1, HAE1 family n=1 Tax=Aliiglaciecola lipolytica E3 TaxID=1127673 RepID=K6X1T7_9ALTE|nr:efflux RND transporter permease subunit [Aliiglaciecola lipolytica]GAC14624.1 hydrophobic/amphiphilic exporter-1, HAE1 family [Aliiglaciecola lipolytica E3]
MNLIEIAVRRPVTVWMFTLAVLLFGFVSLSRLSLNLLPELSYPTLTIRTDYVGAAPGEIEQLVSKPIEEAVGIVKGVRKVTSASKAGQSDVVLEFEWGTEMDMASLEVREKLDVLLLPLDVKRPLLLRFNPSLDPVMRFGLGINEGASDASSTVVMDETAMKKVRTYAEEDIKRKLESVEGVASVRIGGGLENEIHVLINQQRTSQLNIPLADIIKRLKDENVNASGGRVEDGSQEYLVRTLNQFQSLDDMRNLYIATRQGTHIKLGDVAEVVDTYKERSSVTRFDGFEGVEIAIYKEGDANTVNVAKAVQTRLDTLKQSLPENYQLQMVYDQSLFIASALDEVKSAAIIGGILAMFILYFFLKNIWPTLIISISIPVSIIATFNLMYSYDISLNIMSLGGIALAIGLLVDNSIVVLENIDRHKKQNANTLDAASEGTKEVSMAIVASTLTTMAVFFPLVFVEGIAGQLFSDQALTVTFALAASLVVALTLIPMLAAREKSNQARQELDLGSSQAKTKPTGFFKLTGYYLLLPIKLLFKLVFYVIPLLISTIILVLFRGISKLLSLLFTPVLWLFDKFYNLVSAAYSRSLNVAMKARFAVVAIVLGFSALSLLLLPKIGLELIPPLAQGEFDVEITLPTGSRLENTDAVLASLATFTNAQPHVARTYSLAGTGSLMNASPAQGGDHWGKLNVVMEQNASPEDEQKVVSAMRDYLANQAGLESKFGTPELFSFSTPLVIEISGYDLSMLKRYGDKLAGELSKNTRFADIKSSLQNGSPELKVQFDHAKLAQLGLNAPDVSKLIAAKVGGEVASKFSIDDRKVDILVRNQITQRDSIADISRIVVNPNSSTAIPLAAVATIEMSVGPSEITRVGQQRVVLVSANLTYGDLGAAVIDARKAIEDIKLPFSLQAKITGQSEEMEASFNSLYMALALAVFMVYLVMASQFESLLHPFLILFTVPMACAGSIYGLFVTGTNISVVVFIGLIMLAGIVVNNAIVLIDRINQLRAKGEEKSTAIKDAANSRLRPILMTTLTTILGLLPMAIGLGEGSEIRTPMAITVIFGLLFATFLTLFMIPVLYSLFDRKVFIVTPAKDAENVTKNEVVYG